MDRVDRSKDRRRLSTIFIKTKIDETEPSVNMGKRYISTGSCFPSEVLRMAKHSLSNPLIALRYDCAILLLYSGKKGCSHARRTSFCAEPKKCWKWLLPYINLPSIPRIQTGYFNDSNTAYWAVSSIKFSDSLSIFFIIHSHVGTIK